MKLSTIPTVFLLASGLLIPSIAPADKPMSRDEFRKLQSELREKMDEGLDVATKFLEDKIADTPESADLQYFREILAERLTDERKYDEAVTQIQRLLDFQIAHVDQSDSQYGIPLTIKALKKVTNKSGRFYSARSELNQTLVNQAYAALNAQSKKEGFQAELPLSQMTVEKAYFLITTEELESAKSLVTGRLKHLAVVNNSDKVTEESTQAQIRMLRLLTSDERLNDDWRDEFIPMLNDTVSTAVEKFPKSLAIQNDYADTQYLMITRWGQDDPDATKERIEATTKQLTSFASNRSVEAVLRRIELHKQTMRSAKPVSSLVGKKAPDWDVDAWVNTDSTTRDSLKGKVILVDFWAMWCGPCIQTFPHLRAWRKEFDNDKFEIVGVTQYYNMEWDEGAKRPRRSKEDLSGWDERSALLGFLEHHNLKHPVFVQHKDSKMSADYGVRGIPHVVLIDQDGLIRLVKTGAGKATADEIHGKIKELLEKK